MFDTLRLMKTSVLDNYKELDNQEIVRLFKESKDDKKMQDRCIASFFTKNFAMILKVYNKCLTLTNCEKVEIVFDCLCNCLSLYKLNDKTKFTSYYYGALGRCFITRTNYYKTNKRKVWTQLISNPISHPHNFTTSHNYQVLDTLQANRTDQGLQELQNDFVLDLQKSPLSSIKKLICNAFLQGHNNYTQIVPMIKNAYLKDGIVLDDKEAKKVYNKNRKELKRYCNTGSSKSVIKLD